MIPRMGVVNWDSLYPSDTYFGANAIYRLGNPKHVDRLPFFTNKDEEGNYFFPKRNQEDYDRELALAIDAGIDFFMYCWYPDENGQAEIGVEEYPYLASYYSELNKARKLYQSSELKKKIKMCAIIISGSGYSKKDIDMLTDAMREDYYEKRNGRPLVFIFGGYRVEYISSVKDAAKTKGLDPYIVFMDNGAWRADGDYSMADAVSAYASEARNIDSYEELAAKTLLSNEKRKKFGLPIIPILSAGWNPKPRIDRPIPWCKYEDTSYAPHPTGEQIEAATLDLFKWMEENRVCVDENYCVSFAWNEFEEGGYLCPTLSQTGAMNSDTLDGLGRALRSEKSTESD